MFRKEMFDDNFVDGVFLQSSIMYFEEAAKKGHLGAVHQLGELYINNCDYKDEDGNYCVRIDYSKAAEYFKKPAEQGDPLSQLYLGVIYLKDGLQNTNNAIELFSRVTGAECFKKWKEPQLLLDNKSIFENGINEDNTEAVNCLIDAVLTGSRESARRLGTFYLNGDGIEKNVEKAAEWFTISGIANCELGKLYLNGVGVTQDSAKAFELFKSHQEYNPDSQFYIGYMYYIGQGEKGGNYNSRNVSLASVWIKKAADNGSEEAKKFLMDHAKELGVD